MFKVENIVTLGPRDHNIKSIRLCLVDAYNKAIFGGLLITNGYLSYRK